MSSDGKIVSLSVDEGYLVIKVDANKDGEAVLVVKVNLLEVPDEIMSALKKD
jgi:hypothetical protein